jgi:hypothetical protein
MPACLALDAYPCPAKNVLFLEYAVPTSSIVHITLYDAAGRCVQELKNTHVQPGIYQETADLQQVAQGVYFLRLESNGNVITKKAIVLR